MTAPELACPLLERCPGCALGSRPYADGLARKGDRLEEAFAPYSVLSPRLLPPRAASPHLAYRLRAKLVCHGRELGLYQRGSHRVLDISGCRVLSPALAAASEALRRRLPLPIHGADLRESSEGVLITLLTEERAAHAELERTAQELVRSGAAHSVALATRRKGDVRLLAGSPVVVAGPTAARHRLAPGVPYAYAAHGGFVQAHAGQASYVYATIARELERRLGSLAGAELLELFAGNGSLALALAARGARVTAVESYAPAIELAERAAREQSLTVEVVSSDALRFAQQTRRRFAAVLVNPPRRGLERELRDALVRLEPLVLSYVSCEPRTLARDAAHLATHGLALEAAEPLDMIPWSDAVETLAWFTAGAAPEPHILLRDDRYVAVQKPPHLSTLEPDGARSLCQRVRALPGLADAVPLEAWGRDVSGVCWFAANPEAARVVATGERRLSLLVRGNLRKQGTISRGQHGAGARYRKLADVGRHSLATVTVSDRDESPALRDFAHIGRPVLGSAEHGDASTNEFVWHRHGLDRAFVHVDESTVQDERGTTLTARSPLAPDLATVLESLSSD